MWLIPTLLRSAFVPASACLTKESELRSAISALTSEQLFMVSGKPQQPASLLRSWKRERWSQRLCGAAIFDASTSQLFEAKWTASLPDSRAKIYQSPGGVQVLMGNAQGFSLTSLMPPTIAVRGGSLWRTSAPSLLPPPPLWTKPKASSTKERPPESWENWPTEGGIRSGSLFQRPQLVLVMGGQDGSALLGAWPTPMVGAGENSHGQISGDYRRNMDTILKSPTWATPDCNTSTYSNGRMGPNIREQASQWLTPNVPNGGRSVSEALVQSKGMTEDGQKKTVGLESQTRHWPSPRATDGTKGGPNQAGSKGDLMLPSASAQWGTPQARDYRSPDSPDSGNYQRKMDKGWTIDLNSQAAAWDKPELVSAWPTPAARDAKGANSVNHVTTNGTGRMHMDQLANFVAHSPSSPQAPQIPDGPESSPTTPASPRRLNPAFGCWLMGWPFWWTNPGITSSGKLATEFAQFRRQLRLQLSLIVQE